MAAALVLLPGASVGLRADEVPKPKPKAGAAPAGEASPQPKRIELSSRQLPAESTMVLRNVTGQEIEAKLLSAHGDQVKIERINDGRVFIVPIDTFDEYSGERIRSWIDRDPDAVDYSLAISATKNLVNSSTFLSSGRDFKFSEWSYHVTVRNQTRNTLSGAQLEFRLVYDDYVDIAKTTVGPGKGPNQQEGQLVDLPEMVFNDEIEFDTPTLVLHTYEFNPLRAPREYARDTLKGIWIRVVRNGKIIGEYKSNPSAMNGLTWDNEGKTEIRVTNRFRDQLGAGPKN